MTRVEKFMLEAIRLSEAGAAANEGGPFGCVIVKGDEIVGRAGGGQGHCGGCVETVYKNPGAE